MNELEARYNVQSAMEDWNENEKHIKHISTLLVVAAVLTVLLYFLFSFSLYVGDFYNIKTLLNDVFSGSVGIVIYCVVSALLAIVLAGTKHAGYEHFARFRPVALVILLMVVMGILAESFTSSAVQDVKARATASQNTEYQNLTNANGGGNISASPALAAKIAHAQKVLERCKYNMANGKEKHCNGDQGKLDALLASQQAELDAQITASNANMGAKHARIDQLKEEGYNPWIRSISDSFELSISSAVALLMLFIAMMFEAMHYYLSVMKRQSIGARSSLQRLLNEALVNYYQVTGEEYDGTGNTKKEAVTRPAPVKHVIDGEPSDQPEENRQRWAANPAIGGGVGLSPDGLSVDVGSGVIASPKAMQKTAPATAETAVKTEVKNEPQAKPEAEEVTQAPAAEPVKKQPFGFAPSEDTGVKAYSLGGVSGAVAKQQSDAAKPQNTQTLKLGSTHSDTEGQTLSNPEKISAEPPVKSPSDPSNNPSPRVTEGSKTFDTNKLYQSWVSDIENGNVNPSVTASWKWLQQRISKSQSVKKAPTPQYMTEIVQLFIRRAIYDQVLINNPKYRNGLPKYLLKEK